MKTCPYCAEEIQDTAVKCRFCGEWFSSDVRSENKEASLPVDSEEINDIEAAQEQVNISDESKEDLKETENISYKLPEKKIPIGWGWIITIGMFLWGFDRFRLQYEYTSGRFLFLEFLGVILILVAYFWIRKIFVKKNYALTHASILAGIISWFVFSSFFGVLVGIHIQADRREAWAKLESSRESTAQEILPIVQREEALWEILNLEPETYDEEQETIKTLKDLLGVIKEKKSQYSNFFAQYFHYIKDSRSTELKGFSSYMEKFYLEFSEKYQKSIELLIEYFTTGDESIGDEGFDLLFEAMELQEKFESQLFEFKKQIE